METSDSTRPSSPSLLPYPPPLYDAVHGGRSEDLDFYRAAAADAGPVLELGSGHGRIAAALAADGIDVVGIDISDDAITRARTRVPSATFLAADMRDFDLEQRFARILCPFNGMYCVLDEADALKVLQNVHRHLVPGGLFIFDGYAADAFHQDAQEGDAETSFVRQVTADGTSWDVYETSQWQRDTQRIEAIYRHEPGDGRAAVSSAIPQRYLLRSQIEPLLERAGLELVVVHGDFDQSVWDEDSPYLIVTAQRPSAEA